MFLHEILSLYVLKVICPYADSPAGDQRPAAAAGSSAGPAKRRRIESAEGLGIGAGDEPQKCPWQGSYGDLLSKHVVECPNWKVSCPRECGQIMPRRALKQHETTCTKMSVTCKICGEVMRPGELVAHKAENVERHATLLEIKCGELEQDNEEIRRQNAELRRGQVSSLNSVTWFFELSDIPKSPGAYLLSNSFHLCGVGPLVATITQSHTKNNDNDPRIALIGLFHAGHIKETGIASVSPLAGQDVCKDKWAGTFTVRISDNSSVRTFKEVTGISLLLARKHNSIVMEVPWRKFIGETGLQIHVQAVSIGPAIENDGSKKIGLA